MAGRRFCVPRRTEISVRDRQIGARLKTYREGIFWGRPDFAQHAGLDSSQLYRYEAGRVPLRYGDAWRIFNVFTVSPRWLASGEGPIIESPVALPSPQDLGLSGDESFADVYDNHLVAILQAPPGKVSTQGETAPLPIDASPRGRVVVENMIADMGRELVELVPDAQFPDVASSFLVHAAALLMAVEPDTEEVVEDRREAVAEERARWAAPSRGLDTHDLGGLKSDVPRSRSDENPWHQLLNRIRRAVAKPGQKKALAELLHVSPAAVTQWLDGSTSPRADKTLLLLSWVEEQEANEKGPGGVVAPSGQPTR